jgi:hypothetical protein
LEENDFGSKLNDKEVMGSTGNGTLFEIKCFNGFTGSKKIREFSKKEEGK